jgi:hypothetical protein
MATTVAELVAKLSLNSEEFKKGIDDAGRSSEKLTTGFKNVTTSAAAVAGAIVAAGAAIAAFASKSLQTFESLALITRDLAFISGGTAKEVSGLIDVLDDFGVSTETVQRSMVFLSRSVLEGNPALEQLGIKIRQTSGHLKNAHDLFYEVIDALKNTRSETERNALAQEMFGRGWTAMVPIITQGSAALKEAAAASGLTMSEEDIARAQKYKLAIANLGDELEKFKLTIARGIVVPITFAVKWLTELGESANKLLEPADLGDPAERAAICGRLRTKDRWRSPLAGDVK